ncbi:MAG TPA: AraC family transcriptional regulator [Gemmatirosa sp.]
MPVDVLSSVLQDLRVAGSVFCRFAARGAWAVSYPTSANAGFHLVTEGACELRLVGGESVGTGETYDLAAGDFVVVPHGTPHVLYAGHAPAVSIEDVTGRVGARGLVALGDHAELDDPSAGVTTAYVCGSFRFASRRTHPAIAALPPVLVVRAGAGDGPARAGDDALGPWLSVHIAAAMCESAAGRPGAEVVLARLSDVLFVHAIRAYLADAPAGAGGWIGALRDPAVARALALLHAHPERDWTVAGLAREVAMSRSRFAARFTTLVGRPPLGYLADWRMRRAEGWLADEGATVGEVAVRLGYRSEAAFSHAFRRRVGSSPGALRRRSGRHPAPARL